MVVSFVLSFFPRDVLDEILNLIGSVSEGFPSYSCLNKYMKIYVYKSYEYKIGIYSCFYEYMKIYENKVIL